mmetsp:Transcript_8604/g.24269  ORF Transcript_8604/g.24269 Transcript_8604/m.24269 type:complete len:219 (-) Transcript_8604:133-789(-)
MLHIPDPWFDGKDDVPRNCRTFAHLVLLLAELHKKCLLHGAVHPDVVHSASQALSLKPFFPANVNIVRPENTFVDIYRTEKIVSIVQEEEPIFGSQGLHEVSQNDKEAGCRTLTNGLVNKLVVPGNDYFDAEANENGEKIGENTTAENSKDAVLRVEHVLHLGEEVHALCIDLLAVLAGVTILVRAVQPVRDQHETPEEAADVKVDAVEYLGQQEKVE